MFRMHRLKARKELPAFYLEINDRHGTVNKKAIEREH